MTELQQFTDMLERVGIGHGTRIDHSPPGTSVQVEHGHDEGGGWTVTDWQFDADGRLMDVSMYPGEEG